VRGQIATVTLACAGSIGLSSPCIAQVVPDQTLPVGERSQVSGDPNVQIDGGATRGNNLFHSFQQFSIPTGGSASFNNAPNITNIITRVTGKNLSNIDGLIRANGTANLFLINPNGIVFGANARLELGGSFLASTAEGLKFDNGFAFSTSDPQAPPLLTISAPIGLQYGNQIGEIRSQGASLQVPNGQTLNLTGGNVAIDGGRLLAPGGRVELAGVAAAGEVELTQQGQEWRLSVPDGLARADVEINNDAIVNVRSGGGGSIAIAARNLTGTGAGILRAGIAAGLGTVDAQAGDIDINATEAIDLDEIALSNVVLPGGTGNAGNLNITTDTLSLTNGAQVAAGTFGQGNAGNVTITARDAVLFDGVDSNGFRSGAFSSVQAGGIGQGGNVSITTGTLSLTNGAVVSANTFGQGNAGNITITARDAVSFDMVSNRVGSGAYSSVEARAIGQGGNVSITTGRLSLTNGGAVSAVTVGQGNAGNITITARDAVSFDGLGSNGFPSGAFSSVAPGGIGQGGTIAIDTELFSITNGAQLSASSQGQGAAGNLEVYLVR
jgi:filamentous hemagglutinin family protein